jgi:hypothetical protein
MAMETHFTALGRHTQKEEQCGSMEKHIFLITLFGNLCRFFFLSLIDDYRE